MVRPALNSGELVWSGEHWINVIKPQDAEAPSARFSLYHTRYSQAGEGNALHLMIPTAEINLVCTDNPRLGEWINDRFFKMGAVPSPDAPIVKAGFQRQGATHDSPRWVVETEGHRIVAGWTVKEPPVHCLWTLSRGNRVFHPALVLRRNHGGAGWIADSRDTLLGGYLASQHRWRSKLLRLRPRRNFDPARRSGVKS